MAKPSYRIRTPAAAITVRGTIFDAYIEPSNTVWLLLLEGGIIACNDRSDCRRLTEPGQILKITPDGNFSKVEKYAGQDDMSEDDVDEAFPFLRETLTILPSPPLTRDAVITPPPKRETYPKRDPNKPKHTDRNSYEKKKRAYYERKKRQRELRKKRYLEKKRYRERKRRRAQRDRRRHRTDSGLSDAAKTAIGIGIGIGKALGGGGGKRHHRRHHRNSPY